LGLTGGDETGVDGRDTTNDAGVPGRELGACWYPTVGPYRSSDRASAVVLPGSRFADTLV